MKQETKKSEETSVKVEKSERQLLEGKPNMIRLFWYYPTARRNFCLITFNWLANAVVYNGLSYYSANLNVSRYI